MIRNLRSDIAKILIFCMIFTSVFGGDVIRAGAAETYSVEYEFQDGVDTWIYRVSPYQVEGANINFGFDSYQRLYLTGITGNISALTLPGYVNVDAYKNGVKVGTRDGYYNIAEGAFNNNTTLVSLVFERSVDIYNAFKGCTNLKNIVFNSSAYISGESFSDCPAITNVEFNDFGSIRENAFTDCAGLQTVEFKGNSTLRGEIFENCPQLIIISKEGTNAIEFAMENNIPYRYWRGGTTYYPDLNSGVNIEYIYDQEEVMPNLPVNMLDSIDDEVSAWEAINTAMEEYESSGAAGQDQIQLFCEEALSRAATVEAEGNDVVIEDNMLADQAAVFNTVNTLDEFPREFRRNVRVVVSGDEPVNIDKRNIGNNIDSVTVVTDYASLKFDADDSKYVTMEKADSNRVKVTFITDSSQKKIQVSFPGINSDGYRAVADGNNEVIGGKFNPITDEMSAKIDASGVYRVIENEKDFTDIKDKSAEMQQAIKLLASKGIISGTSESEFSPDDSITRAEVAAIILRSLSELNPNASSSFTDVSRSDWFYGVAGSSQNVGIIEGYEDNTFRGKTVIPKVQIVSVGARVLKEEMNYKEVADAQAILENSYNDGPEIPQWAVHDVALATDANMVIKRADGYFGGDTEMTRGDAAIILQRLFDKIW